MTAQRKRRGRTPVLWHAPGGQEFMTAVHATWWERLSNGQRRMSRAQAIRFVLKRPEFAHLRRYSKGRYREKQLSNCREFWSLCRVHIREKPRTAESVRRDDQVQTGSLISGGSLPSQPTDHSS